ncbi:MAG TPA: HAD-IC family P-type ATPase [Candidatus Polarisedimenticolaceae bacterium]
MERGLDGAEASARLARYGRNVLPAEPPEPGWRRLARQFVEPLVLLLLAATAVAFAAWGVEGARGVPFEPVAILAIVVANGVLGFVQESRAERAMASLRELTAPGARVMRDGVPTEIDAEEVVPGDLLLLEEGDRIAADARVVAAAALRVVESILTGESAAVDKDPRPLPAGTAVADRSDTVFCGTIVATGRGRAVVTATGGATELGRIARALQDLPDPPTPLQRELARTGRRIGFAVISICAAILALLLASGGVRDLQGVVQVLLLAVSLAVAAVPEGLAAVTTVTLAVGMQRLARRRVLVRRLSAVETLGATSIVCTDKIGTLTKGEMTVRAAFVRAGRVDFTGVGYDPTGDVWHLGGPVDDPRALEELRLLLHAGLLANNADLVRDGGRWKVRGDPTEGALVVAAAKFGLGEAEIESAFPRLGEVPFSSERRMMTTVHVAADGSGRFGIASKGAPDVLLSRCTHERAGDRNVPLTPDRRAAILASVEVLGGEALRTLGVAYRELEPSESEGGWDASIERGFVFLGVVGILDPPRLEAQDAVIRAQAAGVRVVMITGDHPATARAIAEELGIAPDDVHARIDPGRKLELVRALQSDGSVVAMTGDGVNDAPALKAADIGIAMGIAGTDVAREASDMVLADDDFASIVAGIEEGRGIFESLRAALRYLLSSNAGEVLAMVLGVACAGTLGLVPEAGTGVVLPLLAVQILWINLLTDAAPALALGMGPADPSLMDRPPRPQSAAVLDRAMFTRVAVVGISMAAATLAVMDAALPGGLLEGTGSMPYARTMGFTTLVLAQLVNAFASRSEDRSAFRAPFANRALWAACALSAMLQVAVVYSSAFARAFGTVPLGLSDWLVCACASLPVLAVSEGVVLVRRLYNPRS